MNAVVVALRELWGLFVDDGSLAVALVVWCVIAGLVLPHLLPSNDWRGPLFFIGCVVILLVNIGAAVRRRTLATQSRGPRGKARSSFGFS
jgi:hypothetical protein